MNFPNRAGGNIEENDKILTEELTNAGIKVQYFKDLFDTGEVKTGVCGSLYGWTFQRAWYYWICKGPGIEIEAAEKLQEKHGNTVRASGDCACRGPRFWYKGLACGSYHVDDSEGLKALADTIKELVVKEIVAEQAANK